MSASAGLNDDFLDMLRALVEARAEFVVVGAHALAVHGVPRATGDLDILVKPSAENAPRVMSALRAFGAPIEAHGIVTEDFTVEGTVYQIGLPPRRIDLMTAISGVDFDTVWASRVGLELDGLPLSFIGRDALVVNKRAAGRPKDLADVAELEKSW
jgi:hypothetical protein